MQWKMVAIVLYRCWNKYILLKSLFRLLVSNTIVFIKLYMSLLHARNFMTILNIKQSPSKLNHIIDKVIEMHNEVNNLCSSILTWNMEEYFVGDSCSVVIPSKTLIFSLIILWPPTTAEVNYQCTCPMPHGYSRVLCNIIKLPISCPGKPVNSIAPKVSNLSLFKNSGLCCYTMYRLSEIY